MKNFTLLAMLLIECIMFVFSLSEKNIEMLSHTIFIMIGTLLTIALTNKK